MKRAFFIRGINVGKNRQVSMGELSTRMVKAGFGRVKTVLNSGNVVATEGDADALEQLIGTWKGFTPRVMVRTQAQLVKLTSSSPFSPDDERQYVTFLAGRPPKLKLPVRWDAWALEAMELRGNDLLLRGLPVKATKNGYPTDLEAVFGEATTRTWATVEKVVAAFAALEP